MGSGNDRLDGDVDLKRSSQQIELLPLLSTAPYWLASHLTQHTLLFPSNLPISSRT
jgi:hypothetical protein